MKLSYLPAFAALALTGMSLSQPADAAGPSQWRTIATRTLAPRTRQETIGLNNRDRYRQLQFCAHGAPVRLNSFTVRFDNGRAQNVRVNSRLHSGGCSRVTNLVNARRRLARVDLTYQQIPQGARPPQLRLLAR